ncbi:helix-turn-helix transcriptional regulator [Streptomyces abyssomicinicus]|uniref:helix-turn-helix transcriptional regulator n=1 Tax=Streptomyces abyssomicinicus TaxID=574929 RepID=UPI0012504688|nr:helix-turn-helix transcriptional regulator [Streptomyces abyssomicinicus]
MLESLGLDELAHTIYRFALTRSGCGIEDLLSGIDAPEKDVRRGADRLVQLSLLRPLSGKLIPTRPPIALRTLLQRQQAEVMRQQQEFASVKAAVDRLSEEYEDAQTVGTPAGWEVLDTEAAVHARMERLAGLATVECAAMLPAEVNGAEAVQARRPLDQHLLERGVSVWNIYQESIYNDRTGVAHARWLSANGARIGTVPTLPLWVVLYDRRSALLPVDPKDPAAGAVQVTGAGFLAGLAALFEQMCQSMKPLDASCGPAADQPTPMERELLRLMGQGLTDEAVCRKLGVGLRTARRMIAELMDRLGARSRFEAGANAVDRGWLQPCACGGDRPVGVDPPRRMARRLDGTTVGMSA